jgi:hypothetical protein
MRCGVPHFWLRSSAVRGSAAMRADTRGGGCTLELDGMTSEPLTRPWKTPGAYAWSEHKLPVSHVQGGPWSLALR